VTSCARRQSATPPMGWIGFEIPMRAWVLATTSRMYEAASAPGTSSGDLVIAQASHATGANGNFFRTDLHVTNLGAAPATLTMSLIPRVLSGAPGPPRVHTLAPGQTLESLDVLASEFGLADASVMAYAERHRLPILTFDFQHFRATRPARGYWRLVVNESRYREAVGK